MFLGMEGRGTVRACQLSWFVVIEDSQLFAETPHAAPDSRLDGTERKSHLAGDFSLGETFKEGHLDESPLIRWKLKEKPTDKASPLGRRTTVLWTRHRTLKAIQILAFAVVVEAAL